MKFYNLSTLTNIITIILVLVSINSKANNFSAPIVSDSRIKTFIYNENEVFPIVVHYGYQSNIEFAINERIETLSIGNAYAWRITPAGRRIFIKPLEGSSHTNMTLITNKRTYQFDLESKDIKDGVDKNMVYVVRFFYPEDNFNSVSSKDLLSKQSSKSLQQHSSAQGSGDGKGYFTNSYNYNYSLTGTDEIAPIEVFDDGFKTYMEFPNNNSVIPNIYSVSKNGTKKKVSPFVQGRYVVVNKLSDLFYLKLDKKEVNLFNDNRLSN